MPALDAYHSRQQAFNDMHTRYWHESMGYFLASLVSNTDGTATTPGLIEVWGSDEGDLTKRLIRSLNYGETFYITPLMTRLVSAAAEDWPGDEPVMPEDFPCDRGWFFIPGGVAVIDIRGQVCMTHAFTWEIIGSRVYVALWTDKESDPPWFRNKPGWPYMPKYSPWHLTWMTLGRPLGKALRMGKLLPPEISQAIQFFEGDEGRMAMYIPEGFRAEDMVPHETTDENLAWLVSALRIMQQPLASQERVGLPANVRRGLRGAPYRLKQTAVTVIDFRRRKSDFEGHSEREYTHRFLRRGHWRRQPYKREDGTWDRRRIWIHATIVGDPSLPLVLRAHVNALSR